MWKTIGLVALTVAFAAACTESLPLTVEEARAASGNQSVTGFLLVESEGVRLCEALAESFPPQCGGARISVVGLDLATVDGLRSEQSVMWTDEAITLNGDLSGGVIDAG